jgi:tellurite methyltransferase
MQEVKGPGEKGTSYWDSFYDHKSAAESPSSFALFIQTRFSIQPNLIDVGCGNGRDTFFFSRCRERVVGIDASPTAIANCEQFKQSRGDRNVEFAVANISIMRDLQSLFERIDLAGSCLFYARFFLHAINEEAQNVFLDFFAERMTPNCIMCLEFRTAEDRDGYKAFGDDHYRRFIDPDRLSFDSARRGLKTEYFDHGKGLAVYNGEDPYIARLVFSRPPASRG